MENKGKLIEANEKKSNVIKNQNRFESNKKYFTICIYAFVLILLSVIVVFTIMNWSATKGAISRFISAISPFLSAILISFIVYPIMMNINKFLKRFIIKKDKWEGLRKGLSILFAYIIIIGLIIVTLFYVFPQIINSIQDLSKKIPDMYEKLLGIIQNLEEDFPIPFVNFDDLKRRIVEFEPDIISHGTNLVANLFPFLWNLSYTIVMLVVNIVLSFVISCYMLIDKKNLIHNFKCFIYAILKKRHADAFCKIGNECNRIFSGFLIGKALDSLIIGILCFILMSILRLPFALLISVFVGVTNMIPYFGPFIGALPGIFIYLLFNVKYAVVFGIMVLALQQFDGLYLGPKILGDSTGLKPLWVIFAITVGGAYFGVLGMFLGVPVVAVFSYLLNTFIKGMLKKKGIQNL